MAFLWCRDRNIYGPSAKELERLARLQRQQYLDGWLHEVSAALPAETIALMDGSLAEADGPTGFNAMKADAGRATLDNILEVTGRLAFIRKLDLPRKMLSTINPAWVDQVVRRVGVEPIFRSPVRNLMRHGARCGLLVVAAGAGTAPMIMNGIR